MAKTGQVEYSSYSGCDIVASITIPEISSKPFVIGTLQTISYSIHREVQPIRTIGEINPKGFVSGTRTIAGSLIFTVFDNNLVHNLVETIKSSYAIENTKYSVEDEVMNRWIKNTNYSVMDEMPPFDITISLQNEYGNHSSLVIKGVIIVDEGQVMSIEDMITENTMSYMARDIQVLRKDGIPQSPLQTSIVTTPNPKKSSLNTLLDSLTIDSEIGTLSPAFSPSVNKYKLFVDDESVLPVTTDSFFPIAQYPNDVYISKKAFLTTPNIIIIEVSADGQPPTIYYIECEVFSGDANLDNLTIDGIIIPGFDPEHTEYVLPIGYNAPIPKIEPVVDKSSGKKVTMNRVWSVEKETPLTIVVESKSGGNTKTYTIILSRSSSDNSLARYIVVNPGTLLPSFDSQVLSYDVLLEEGSKIPTISATPMNPKSFLEITNFKSNAENRNASVTIISEDATSSSIYNFTIKSIQ